MSTLAISNSYDEFNPRSFARDERGAVMLMGVFFASFLVGSLWYLIGIGQSLIFRQLGQEIADSAALSSASAHAQGMNFISALNLVQLILVFAHIVFAIIFIISIIVAVLGAPTVVAPIGSILADSAILPVWKGYGTFMFVALETCAVTQTITSGATPWLGTLAAANVGGRYPGGRNSFSLSPSMIPTVAETIVNPNWWSDAIGAAGNPVFGLPPLEGKLGLPVQEKQFNALCERVYKAVYNWLVSLIINNPVYNFFVTAVKTAKPLLDFPGSSFVPGVSAAKELVDLFLKLDDALRNPDADGFFQSAINFHKGAGASVTSFFLCNNLSDGIEAIPFVGSKIAAVTGAAGTAVMGNPLVPPAFDPRWGTILGMGPKATWGPAENGSPWMAVLGYQGNVLGGNGTYGDRSNPKVGLLAGAGASDTPVPTYVAQAEFYFDCGEGWGGATCNQDDAASYSMRWTARLRQVRRISPAQLFADVAVDAAGNAASGLIDKVLGGVTINGAPVGDVASLLGATSFTSGQVVDGAKDRVNSKIESALQAGESDVLH